jgi:hypothetical protein
LENVKRIQNFLHQNCSNIFNRDFYLAHSKPQSLNISTFCC